MLQQRLSERTRREASILSYLEQSLDADQLRAFNNFMSGLDGVPSHDVESDLNASYDRSSKKAGIFRNENGYRRGEGEFPPDEPYERSRSAGSKDMNSRHERKSIKKKRRSEFHEDST